MTLNQLLMEKFDSEIFRLQKKELIILFKRFPFLSRIIDIQNNDGSVLINVDLFQEIELFKCLQLDKNLINSVLKAVDSINFLIWNSFYSDQHFSYNREIKEHGFTITMERIDKATARHSILVMILNFLAKMYGDGDVEKTIKTKIPVYPGLINSMKNRKTSLETISFNLMGGHGKIWYGFIPKKTEDMLKSLDLFNHVEKKEDELQFKNKASENVYIQNLKNQISKEHFDVFIKNKTTYSLTGNVYQWMRWAYPKDFDNIYRKIKHLVDKDFYPLLPEIAVAHYVDDLLKDYEPVYDSKLKKCIQCGKLFPVLRKDKLYCSNKCRVYFQRKFGKKKG